MTRRWRWRARHRGRPRSRRGSGRCVDGAKRRLRCGCGGPMREALSNVARHAGARNVRVAVTVDDDDVTLTVSRRRRRRARRGARRPRARQHCRTVATPRRRGEVQGPAHRWVDARLAPAEAQFGRRGSIDVALPPPLLGRGRHTRPRWPWRRRRCGLDGAVLRCGRRPAGRSANKADSQERLRNGSRTSQDIFLRPYDKSHSRLDGSLSVVSRTQGMGLELGICVI